VAIVCSRGRHKDTNPLFCVEAHGDEGTLTFIKVRATNQDAALRLAKDMAPEWAMDLKCGNKTLSLKEWPKGRDGLYG
jgi:hypothetical protein